MSRASKKDRRRWRAWFFYSAASYFLVGEWPSGPHWRHGLTTNRMLRMLAMDGGSLVARIRAARPSLVDHRKTYKGIPF